MQEKLDALVRTQAMQLFRQQGLHFTMQQVAEPLHISKKTIYTVYPSKEALLLDMVDHAFAEIHHCKQKILAGSSTLQEKLRAVIIAMPTDCLLYTSRYVLPAPVLPQAARPELGEPQSPGRSVQHDDLVV